MEKILIIEDEKQLARFIELELLHEGFRVKVANDGQKGLELAIEEDWDVIILDVMLPFLSGMEVCRRIRNEKEKEYIPILMLTARDSVVDRVSGLDSGADDYITKPFSIEELMARIRAVLRRSKLFHESASFLSHKNLILDLESRKVSKDGDNVELTKTEFELLSTLMQNADRVMTRDLLIDKIWGHEVFVETNVVDVYIRYLRSKLDTPGEESLIQTVRGVGYVMRT